MTGHLEDVLSAAYLDFCRDEGVPATTRRRREATLRSVRTAGTASREELEHWWKTRSDRAPATRANDLATLRGFYRWAKTWEHRDDDPSRRIPRPKVANGLPKPVTELELTTLRSKYRHADPLVFRAIVLGAYAGLRVAEAASLTWESVDQVNGHLTVRGKGAKARRIPLDPATLAGLGRPASGDINVVTGTTDALTAEALGKRVNRALRAAGVPKTFHALRHRFGTVAYQATGDIVAVAKLMGHANIQTTMVYAAAADAQAARIAAAVALPVDEDPDAEPEGRTP